MQEVFENIIEKLERLKTPCELGMIENADIPTALNYVGDGEWYRDGEFYNIIAWQPLPQPYHQKGEINE